MNSIDWGKAPAGAELFLPNQQGTAEVFVKFTENAVMYAYPTMSSWARWAGESKETILERFKFSTRELASGGLPPIGSTVRIVKLPLLPIWPQAEQFIGADCTLHAVFMTGDTRMVAVEHQEDLICCCFRADMVRTAEQIKAIDRTNAVSDMVASLGMDDPGTAEYIRCGLIYDAGYRKQVME